MNMLTQFSNFLRNERGASAVEFAFVAPIMVLFSVLLIDIGRAMWASTTLEHVAREGARYAAVRGSSSDFEIDISDATAVDAFEDLMEQRATGFLPADIDVDAVWAPSNDSGDTVTVTVTYTYTPLIAGFFAFDPIPISGRAAMIIM